MSSGSKCASNLTVKSYIVRCRWRGTSPSLTSWLSGTAIALGSDPSSAIWRYPNRVGLVRISQGQERPLIDGCRESEVSLLVVERRNALWLEDGFDALRPATGRGDATGTRSGSPCQDAVYYTAHLALVAKSGFGGRLAVWALGQPRGTPGHLIACGSTQFIHHGFLLRQMQR